MASSTEASEAEKELAHALGSRSIPKDEVLRLIRKLPTAEKFVMRDTWIKLSCDASLENWRRLESYKLLINRCMAYPCDLESFIKEVITPLGINESRIVDMTMAQALPMERKEDEAIRMVNLPIPTAVGPASLYFAVRRPANTVERAAVYPHTVETDTP